MQLKTFSIIPVFFALSYLGECEFYNEPEPIPESILGQWQEIARWTDEFPELEPDRYTIEFFSDGTYYGPYGFHQDTSGSARYEIASDSLILSKEGRRVYIYRYTFIDKKQLQVEYISGDIPWIMGLPTFHIFERVKNE
jgi:hypothetical protein